MPLIPEHPKYCHCCLTEGVKITWDAVIRRMARTLSNVRSKQSTGTPSSRASQSKASERYTPAGSTMTIPSTSGSQTTNSKPSNPPDSDENTHPTIQTPATNTGPSVPPIASQRILFAVQGSRWSLDPEQIPVSSLLHDAGFFRELKVRYKKHRNMIKRIMSPFRFRFCRFVKVRTPIFTT